MRLFAAVILGAGLLGALAAGTALGDATVIMKDGRKFTGQLIESADRVGIADAEGLKIFPRDEVDSIERDGFSKADYKELRAYREAQKKADQAGEPGAALLVWVKYVEQRPKDDPLKVEGEKQVKLWTDAVQAGKVIWAGKLMLPADREKMRKHALAKLDEGLAALRKGEVHPAAVALREAALNWPDHAGIQFYLGVALQRDRDPRGAAAAYQAVLNDFPEHVPTLNNLAILENTRKEYRVGVLLIIQAMLLAPDVVPVNDNGYRTALRVEEAKVGGLNNELARLRNEASRMEAQMRQQGMVRWGTTWLPVEKFKEIEKTNRDVDAQIQILLGEVNALNMEMEVLKARIVELDRQRSIAPRQYDLVRDDNGDGIPDRFYALDALTKEKIDLLLAEQFGRLAGREQVKAAKILQGQQLQANKVSPPRQLDYLLLEDAGDQLMKADGAAAPTADGPAAESARR